MNPNIKKKKRTADLAILGGQPAFEEQIHVGRPNIGQSNRFLQRTRDILDRRWLSNNGPYVQEFERELSKFLRVKHAIVTCNATVALGIITRALGFAGEVIVPSFTFVATAHALQWQEIKPVFCDIDSCTHNLDPACVEKMITPRTTGIIGVHVWGRPCAIEQLTRIARRHRLKVCFDAAHAFGCSHNGTMIGNFGSAEVFSFHATKFFNTFEGGAITTNDDKLAEKIRLMKNFGFSGYDNVIHLGMNGKMPEVCAAMGLTNLECLDQFVAANRLNIEDYQAGLAGIPGVALVPCDSKERRNYQYVVIEVDVGSAGISRDDVVSVLHAENVLARKYFWPGCHRMEPYRSYYPHSGLLLPETERIAARVIVLPTGNGIRKADVSIICDIIRWAVAKADAVRDALAKTRS